jgi:hypothetical protein
VEVSNNKPTKTGDHEVVITGDSDSRGSSVSVKNFLSANIEVIGVVKPEASVENIVNSTITDLKNLTKNYVIVLNGGSNDVNNNNMNLALSQITVIQDNSKTNIIIQCIPHRCDLPDFSCVNSEIQVFNRKLVKIVKLFKHTTILEANFNTELFTRHGLHPNGARKEVISKQIASLINKLIRSERKTPISLISGNPSNQLV